MSKIWLKIKDHRYYIFYFLFFLAIYRIYNAWHFNPYWGYDGGEHIDYLFSLIKNNQIPSILDNTVAWHEPLYYFLLWPIGKLLYFFSGGETLIVLKAFGVLQSLISVAVSYLIYKVFRLIAGSINIAIYLTIFLTFLPPLNQASTFLTNELLNYFFIFLIFWYFLSRFIFNIPKRINFTNLGLICGLALLTKITALIAVLSIVIVFVFKYIREKGVKLKDVLLFLIILILLNVPWIVYKNINIVSGFSVNNTNLLESKPLALDERLNFFTNFDTDIFVFPYWYSGGRSFWSMLIADSFYDYYGTIENKDYINHLIINDPQELVRTTHAPSYVSVSHHALAKILVYYALFISVMLIFGLGFVFLKYLKSGQYEYLFFSVSSFGFLAAIIYSAYRYPYYDHGIVKSIFIFPFYVFPIWGFFEMIKKYRHILNILLTLIATYVIIILKYYLVINFAY